MKLFQTNGFRTRVVGSLALAFGLSLVGCSSDEKAGEEGEVAATDEAAATPPEQDTSAAPATPAPEVVAAPVPGAAPMSGGSVLYVKVGAAEVKEQPNAGSRTIGKLTRGDHVYVTVEGAWAKFGDNKYVATSALTEQGIGRSRRKASWSTGK